MSENKVKTETEIKADVKRYVIDNFLLGIEDESFGDNESFLEKGIIDSTGILELVSFIEETFSIKIQDEELVPDNLDSLENITTFISQKQKAD